MRSAILVFVAGLLLATSAVASSSATTSAPVATSGSSINDAPPPLADDIPEWLEIHKNSEIMEEMMELARKHHEKDIEKAKHSYISYTPEEAATAAAEEAENKNENVAFLNKLKYDHYSLSTPIDLPDFSNLLEPELFVTTKDTPLFSAEECHDVINRANQHFQTHNEGEWSTIPSGRYDVGGFWIYSIPSVQEWFNNMVKNRLFPLLKEKFPHFVDSLDDLVVDNAYVFKYTSETGRRTDIHTDSGCLSFTICLNGGPESETDFGGGGTWFMGIEPENSDGSSTSPPIARSDGVGGVLEMSMGQCTVRPGGVLHYGSEVTSGTRYIIGGFCMNAKKVEYVRMLLNVGQEFAQQSNHQKAIQAFEAAIALNPNFHGAYAHLAQSLIKLGQEQRAQTVLQHCLEHVNPHSSEVAYSLGAMYLEQNLEEKAKKCMEVCLQADEYDEDAMLCIAEACHSQGDISGEEEWYERLVSIPGGDKDLKIQAQAYCNLGILNQGKEKEIGYYKKSLELRPNAFSPLFSLASAYANRQKRELALELFHKAMRIAAPNTKQESETLTNMYKVSIGIVGDSPSSSQQEMMQRLIGLMGQENFDKLAALRGK